MAVSTKAEPPSSGLWSDWGISSSLEVRESQQYGRGVYAVTALSPGAAVMQAKPLVHVLSNDVRGHVCDNCLGESESLLKCGRCKFVRYCGKECQRGDWRCHGGECRGMAAVLPHTPTPLVRLVTRCVHLLSEERSRLVSDFLCSHREALSSEVKKDLATLMIGVKMLLDTHDSATMEQAYTILCKALSNTFTIHRADLDEIGAGIYGGPSLLNHSCMPNCVAVFNGATLTVRTIKSVQPGEQLFISYVDLLERKEERDAVLQRNYCFQCNCERCLTEYNSVSPFRMMYVACENISEDAAREAEKIGTDSLKKVKDYRKKRDWRGMVTECELALSRLAPTLHHMHYVTLSLLQQMVYACIEAGEWTKAITASRSLTRPLQCFLPEYHPVLAVHLLRLGKLYRLSGTTRHLQHSVTHLSQAVQKLRVVYGPDHSSTTEALDMLQDSQRELSMRNSV